MFSGVLNCMKNSILNLFFLNTFLWAFVFGFFPVNLASQAFSGHRNTPYSYLNAAIFIFYLTGVLPSGYFTALPKSVLAVLETPIEVNRKETNNCPPSQHHAINNTIKMLCKLFLYAKILMAYPKDRSSILLAGV